MRKQVVSVRLLPETVALVDRYIELLKANVSEDHPAYIKNRSEFVDRSIINFNIAIFDFLNDSGYIKGDEFDDLP